MEQIAGYLLEIIEQARPLLHQISAEEASVKPGAERWSKQEILGHLIDSAGNNQQKFLRAMQAAGGHGEFVGYAQDFWVNAQHYNTANWVEIIALWEYFNRHLAHVMQHTAPEKLENTISIDGSQAFSLSFLMADYVEHLKHHLNQILPEAGFKSSFENLY
jgi:hypothetical protein